ncbi:MAG: response regulator, partial [bacterium]|nr:response regulator [bacterium]
IREQFSLYELPVIILTARNTIPDLVAGFEAGANDYLTKPLTKSELLVRVNTLVTLKRTVAEHKEAKFKLLQDRMSPHFLFNSLNTIHGLLQSDVEKANSALLKLAHNYRFLMDQVLKSVIPFEEEWVFLKNYLELQELQLGEILSTEMTLDGSFGEVFIPPLTIQPILHNCLKHGQKGSKEDWRISVRAERRDEMVRVVVENNDTGLNKEGEDECRGSLDNILQRLKYLCKEAAVTTENSDGGGTRVEINFRVWHE